MIEIIPTIPESLRQQAGQIYYEAFRRKLQPLVGRPAETLSVLTSGLNLKMAIGAVAEGRLLGLAGLQSRAGVFSRVFFGDSLARLGLLRGLYAWVVLGWFASGASVPPGYLRLADLAVAESARGQGIGSRLLEAVAEQARAGGYRAVRLEVVDTNAGARRLYERHGFVRVASHPIPIPRNWLDFTGYDVMVKTI